jgi:capsular polysaccharide biosynthesis protein
MEVNDFFHILKRRKGVIISAWLIFIILAALITFTQPLKYEAKSRLLIVQNVTGVDPYTVSKSNQYLSSLFSQIVYSNAFFSLVTGSNKFDIDKDYFSSDYKKQMKTWQKTISAQSNDAGIISISIYHPNTYQAEQIALGVNDILITQSFNFQSSDEGVAVKIIDQPLISDYPVKPNIIFNFLAFSFLGVLSGLIYLYFFPNKKPSNKKVKRTTTVQYQAPTGVVPDNYTHPAERVIIEEPNRNNPDIQEEYISHEIQGNIKNLINLNRL